MSGQHPIDELSEGTLVAAQTICLDERGPVHHLRDFFLFHVVTSYVCDFGHKKDGCFRLETAVSSCGGVGGDQISNPLPDMKQTTKPWLCGLSWWR